MRLQPQPNTAKRKGQEHQIKHERIAAQLAQTHVKAAF